MNQRFLSSVVQPIEEGLSQMFEDLKACHEYYCRYNCGTLVEREIGMAHTPRCRKMQEEYGMIAYPRETAFSRETFEKLKAVQPKAPEGD